MTRLADMVDAPAVASLGLAGRVVVRLGQVAGRAAGAGACWVGAPITKAHTGRRPRASRLSTAVMTSRRRLACRTTMTVSDGSTRARSVPENMPREKRSVSNRSGGRDGALFFSETANTE